MRLKKLIGLFTAGLMTVMMSVPAVAATTYTPVAGTSCTFKKYLIMDAGDAVPAATFKFNIEPGTARAAVLDNPDTTTVNEGEMEVLAGVGSPTIADVTFAPDDVTATAAGDNIDVARKADKRADGLTATTGVELEAGEKYATKTATVDFSGVSFPEPGIYRYIITETASEANAAMGIMNDNDTDRVLDVYVIDEENATTHVHELTVAAYVMHTDDDKVVANANRGSADVAAAAAALRDKTDGFTNEYHVKDLAFKKAVAGNQASRDKYFKFTVKVDGLIDGKSYTVSLGSDGDDATLDGNADATSGTNSATITANQEQTNPASVLGSDLKTGVNFYLQHGQSIVIRGLSENATYEITEDAEDYKSTAAGVTGYTDQVKTDSTKATIGAVAGTNKTVKTSFLNERSGIIPTGVLLSVGPWVLLGAVLLGGVIFFAVRSKKKYDEE
ncbi:MAG: QVPTGV class sortase B protein-sorting domain-containing protein [Eubacterium sp.]|nr:QVPTGV class sortase B protein-sorting domain-containing protein [Eubacterium sp.]